MDYRKGTSDSDTSIVERGPSPAIAPVIDATPVHDKHSGNQGWWTRNAPKWLHLLTWHVACFAPWGQSTKRATACRYCILFILLLRIVALAPLTWLLKWAIDGRDSALSPEETTRYRWLLAVVAACFVFANVPLGWWFNIIDKAEGTRVVCGMRVVSVPRLMHDPWAVSTLTSRDSIKTKKSLQNFVYVFLVLDLCTCGVAWLSLSGFLAWALVGLLPLPFAVIAGRLPDYLG